MEDRVRARGRCIRLGMVGGGEGAFIGAVHRMAARLDDHFELVAGALSASPEKAARSTLALGLDPARSYDDFAIMAQAESARPDGIEAVAIVTPNHMHGPAIRAFLDAGIHVICDKPLTTTLDEARDLAAQVRRSGLVFVLTHNYTGYPLVRQARAMVREGALGDIRLVQVEYAQDWLTESTEGRRQQTGGMAHGPGPFRRGRLHRRHRNACLQSRRLRHRARHRRALRGSDDLCAGGDGSTTMRR